jgi:hypothetical protein
VGTPTRPSRTRRTLRHLVGVGVTPSTDVVRFRLDLGAIEASLRTVQRDFEHINAALSVPRDPMTNEVLANMLAGYGCVDRALADEVDLFALGNSRQLLELNTVALCGESAEARQHFAPHIGATERRFYGQEGGGVKDLMEWLALHKGDDVWRRASGTYIRILTLPQLYVEGNHRTGALMMSYILAREGLSPFVVTVENAKAYFDPSALVKGVKKRGVVRLTRLPKLQKRFARLLKEQGDERFLRTLPPNGLGEEARSQREPECLTANGLSRKVS